MEKMDWITFLVAMSALFFENNQEKALELAEKQQLAMNNQALSEENKWRIQYSLELLDTFCQFIERNILLEEHYSKFAEELEQLEVESKQWKYWLPFFSLKKIKLRIKDLQMELNYINEEVQSPRSPIEWEFGRMAYDELSAVFQIQEDWNDKVAHIKMLTDWVFSKVPNAT